MFKLNTTIFITALAFAVSAHAMNPDAPKQNPRSCEERFIDKFIACSSNETSSLLMNEAVGECSARLMNADYERCAARRPEKEKIDGEVEVVYGLGFISHFLRKFSLVKDNHHVEGALFCKEREGNSVPYCFMEALRSQVANTLYTQPLYEYGEDFDIHLSSHCLVPLRSPIFPALKALHAVQKKQRQQKEKEKKEEVEKRKIKHIIHPSGY